METYQAVEGGGYYVLKNGAKAGYIPADHPLVAQIEARAAKREVTIVQASRDQPATDAPTPTLADVIALLIDKKVITQADIDKAIESR